MEFNVTREQWIDRFVLRLSTLQAGAQPATYLLLGFWAVGRRGAWLDVATGKVDNVRVLLQLVEESAQATRPRARAN